MLVLSRERDTTIQIGPNVRVKVLAIQKQRVKLGVEAPSHVRVVREEIAVDPASCGPGGDRPPRPEPQFPILVVEDERSHALLITKALQDCFLSDIRVVETGGEALRVLENEGSQEDFVPRLVFLDFHLPDMSGLDVLRSIRSSARFKTTPVVLLSAEQRESVVVSCLEAGANAFVSKAIHFDDFRRSVARTAMFWTGECRLPQAAPVA